MNPRKKYQWKCGDRSVLLGEKTLVMGILNTTPDSFSDGGSYYDTDKAVERAIEMVEQGADIIDIGGESTRPGADSVSVAEELRRTVPVIEKVRERSDTLISIDTMKSEVAKEALEAGADIINDVSAFEADERMVELAASTHAGVVLMHMKGTPKSMQDNPVYGNVAEEVIGYLKSRADFSVQHGVERDHLVIDPGIGFGKTLEHNLELLQEIPKLAEAGFPVLVGASRKSLIGHLLARTDPTQRLSGSLGIAAWSIMNGAHILRVHDVFETCDVCRIVDTLLIGEP